MAKLIYKNGLPPPDEFRQVLSQAMSNANPVDDLLELSHQLYEYEQKYRMSSPYFYEQYQAGLLDDELQHCIEWAAAYSSFVETRRKLEHKEKQGGLASVIGKWKDFDELEDILADISLRRHGIH